MHHGRCPPPGQVGRPEALLRSRPGFQTPGRIHFGLWPSHSPSQACIWKVGECLERQKNIKIKRSSPLSQGKAGVEETELEDCGLESEQRAARRYNHALALPESREIIRQIKEIRELKTKHRKALLPICRSSSARGPPPNGMEDVTRTSLLMRKLAIFYSPPPVSRPPLMGNMGNCILPPLPSWSLVNGQMARLSNLAAATLFQHLFTWCPPQEQR